MRTWMDACELEPELQPQHERRPPVLKTPSGRLVQDLNWRFPDISTR